MKKKIISLSLPVGLILLVLAFVSYSVNSLWGPVSYSMLGVGSILTLFYIFSHIKETTAFLGRRDTKYGTNALISIIAVLGIVILINFIVSKRNLRYDLTSAGLYSLSEQTIKILENLEDDVEVYAFFKQSASRKMQDLLTEYSYCSPKFKYEFIDPDEKPELAKQYNVTAYNTTVLVSGDKQERISAQEEQDLTNALVKVTREGTKVIYFSEGHGEKNIDSNEREGFSAVADLIREENYEVKKIFLAREENFPTDCSVLVIPGPKNELFPNELQMVDDFINTGGAVLFMLDPDPSPGMNEYFDKWGITVGNNIVVDFSGVGRLFGAGPAMPLVNTFSSHAIVEDFEGVACFFPYVRSLSTKDLTEPGVSTDWLVKTTERSFGETELQGNRAEFNEDKDTKGPVTVGVVVTKRISADSDSSEGEDTKPKGNGKMVVFGDSDFANNMYVKMQANGNLFMNAINWLAEESDLVSIRAKDPEDRRLNLTQRQTKIMFYISMIGIPAIVIISGISVFYRRRKL